MQHDAVKQRVERVHLKQLILAAAKRYHPTGVAMHYGLGKRLEVPDIERESSPLPNCGIAFG